MPSDTNKLYDPENVSVSIGGQEFKGFASGDVTIDSKDMPVQKIYRHNTKIFILFGDDKKKIIEFVLKEKAIEVIKEMRDIKNPVIDTKEYYSNNFHIKEKE